MYKIIAFFLPIIILHGCSNPSYENDPRVGPPPYEDYRPIIKRATEVFYHDPYSLRRVRISDMFPGRIYQHFGWIVCVEANAKNQFGAYVGIRRHAFVINYGEVVAALESRMDCNADERFYRSWNIYDD